MKRTNSSGPIHLGQFTFEKPLSLELSLTFNAPWAAANQTGIERNFLSWNVRRRRSQDASQNGQRMHFNENLESVDMDWGNELWPQTPRRRQRMNGKYRDILVSISNQLFIR